MSSQSEKRRTPPEELWLAGNKCRITRTVENDECGAVDTRRQAGPTLGRALGNSSLAGRGT